VRQQAQQMLEELKNQAGDAAKGQGEGNAGGAQPKTNDPPADADPKRPPQPGRGDKPGDQQGTPDAKPKPEQGKSDQPGQGDAGAASSRPSDRQGQPGREGEGTPRPQNPGDNPDPPRPGDQPNTSPTPSPEAGGAGTGAPTANRPGGDATGSPTAPEPGTAPDARHAAQAGDLQLERFPKDPSREMLKDLGMTADEYQAFLKDLADLQKRRQAQAAEADKADRQRGASTGGSAANRAAKRVEGGTDPQGKLERGGAALAPPEYRDGYKGFTEDVSKSAGGAKKD
jgi:hypothetical protein